MRQHRNMWGKAGLALLVLLLAATALSAQTKVRVKDPAAVIRIEPAANGEIVQDKVAVGTEFTVERKTGDWYEIKYRSAIGVLLSGFIHQSQVEEIKAEAPVQKIEPEPVQKPVVREESAAQELGPGLEISLFGGLGMTSVKGQTTANDRWSSYYGFFDPITENTIIDVTSKSGMFFGGGLGYFFSPNLGVQLNFGYLKSDSPNTSNFTFNFTNTVTGRSYSYPSYQPGIWDSPWNGTGSLVSIPVSLNIVARFGSARMQGYVTAGGTLFLNSFEGASSLGYGDAYSYYYYSYPYYYFSETIDAYQIGLTIPKTSWTAFGGDVGAGFTFMVSPMFGLFVEGKYFLCPAKDLTWDIVTGTYKGLFGNLTGTLGQTGVDYIYSKNAMTMKINPSFFQAVAGVKIKL